MKLLVIDTKTGGLDPQVNAILQIAAVELDTGTGRTHPIFDINVRDLSGICDAEALEVNKIDLVGHNWAATSLVEAAALIVRVIAQRYCYERPIIVGHNVAFDVGFARRLFRLGGFKYPFSRRTLDTASVLRWLMLTGQVEQGSASSSRLFELTDCVPPEATRHTALGDAQATANAIAALLYRYGGF